MFDKLKQYIKQQQFAKVLIVLFVTSAMLGFIALLNSLSIDKSGIYIRLLFECFSGITIIILWLSIAKENTRQKADWGLGFLALAIFAWSVGDNLKIYGIDDRWIHYCISTINSVSFLFSIKYLEFEKGTAWEWLYKKIKRTQTLPISIKDLNQLSNKILIIILFAVLFWDVVLGNTIPNSSFSPSKFKIFWAGVPDFLLSIMTIVFLLVFFNKFFKERQLSSMTYLVVIISIIILLAQFYGLLEDYKLDYRLQGDVVLTIYRPLLIILFFIIAVAWLRLEKEKIAHRQRRDMNHAVRGTLNLLRDDMDNKIIKIKNDDEQYEMYIALEDTKLRVQAMYDLHNFVHEERQGKLNFKKYINRVIFNIETGLNYQKSNITSEFQLSKDFNSTRTQLRKVAAILLELSINASKVARKLGKFQDKKLHISIIEKDRDLNIIVKDNGKHYDRINDSKKGYGMERLHTIVEGDLGGSIHSNDNELGGTTFDIYLPLGSIKN